MVLTAFESVLDLIIHCIIFIIYGDIKARRWKDKKGWYTRTFTSTTFAFHCQFGKVHFEAQNFLLWNFQVRFCFKMMGITRKLCKVY